MAKYYCQNSDFRNITDAPNPLVAAEKTLRKIIKNEELLSLLMVISERGFCCKKEDMIFPVLPLLKKMDFISDNIDLEKLICESLKIKREDISDREINWLITGNSEEEGEGDVTKN